MVARLDDTAKLRIDIFMPSDIAPTMVFTTRLVWSKNVLTEDQCPQQICLGAMEKRYSTQIGLSVWLEYALENGNLDTFVFEIDGTTDPKNIKSRASRYMMDVIKSDDFFEMEDFMAAGPLGSHSIRNFACTIARRCGCLKEYVDYRERRKRRRM